MARILAVEAEPSARQAVARLLRRSGHEVHEAAEGSPALRIAARRSFDLAIIDHALPEVDGLEVLSRLRQIQPGCMRILTADPAAVPAARDAARHGAVSRVLEKPLEPGVISQAVAEILAARAGLAEVIRVQQRAVAVEESRMLSECLRGGAVSLALQPIISAQDRSTFGYEALLRSDHPVLGGPLSLLAAAERHQATGELTDLIFARAEEWLSMLPAEVRLFLHLHPEDLGPEARLEARLERLEPHAGQVVLEISEHHRLDQLLGRADLLIRIQRRGFALAVDDLGSGHASLGLLAALRPAFVKADMGFIRGLDASPERRQMLRLLQQLTQALGARLVAEGVETPAEAAALVDCAVPLMQGFLFGRPVRQLSTSASPHDLRQQQARVA